MNASIEEMIAITEPIKPLKDVRKDKYGNIFVPVYKNPTSNDICNYIKASIDKRTTAVLSVRRYGGYIRLGSIEDGANAYICKTWGQALSVYMNTQVPVIVATTSGQKRKLRKYAAEHNLSIRYPTIFEELVSTKPAKPSIQQEDVSTGRNIIKKTEQKDTLIYIGEDLFKPIEPTSWLIRDFIPRNMKLGFIYAPSGIGKTFYALDIAFHIAAGRPSWHGFICHKAKVLYVAGESTTAISARIMAHAKVYGDDFKDDFAFFPFYHTLSSPEHLKEFVTKLHILKTEKGFCPDLIIFDTWNNFFSGDENDATAIAIFKAEIINRIMLLTGSTILFCHHTPKQNDRDMRGSTAIKGMADFMTLINKEDSTTIRATVTKNRLGAENQYVDMRIKEKELQDWGTDEDGMEFTGGYLEYIGNSKTPTELETEEVDYLTKIKEATTLYGKITPSNEWTISAEALRTYLLKDLHMSEEDVSSIFKISDCCFFPVLITSGYICIGKNDAKEIISITVIDDNTNSEISKNREFLTNVANPSNARS